MAILEGGRDEKFDQACHAPRDNVPLGEGAAQATTIPSTISSTLTITTNSQLTSNVSCTLTGADCIKFGANNITLKLNGFTITGNGGLDSCTFTQGENAIDTNGKNNVVIRGPGLVTQFNGHGVVVSGNKSALEGVAITSICLNAILVSGSSNEVEGNSISRVLVSPDVSGPAIAIVGNGQNNGHNSILHNEVGGTGPVPGNTASSFDNGINVGFGGNASPGNLIQENNVSGNPLFGIAIGGGSTGNIVRRNQALGNVNGADIFDGNAAGANSFDNNLCQTSQVGSPPKNICQLPDIAGHSNFHPDGD